MKRLSGVKVAMLLADGFEQVEVTGPLKTLLRRGATVDLVGIHRGNARGVNLIYPGKKLRTTRLIDEVSAAEYDALFIPGGFAGPDFLRQSEKVRAFVQAFDRAGKPIATLCHGPWVLVSAGLVRGRRLAAWPGIQDDIRNAGGTWEDASLVRDRNWISSRHPLDLPVLEPALVEHFERARGRSATSASERGRQRPSDFRPRSRLWALVGAGLFAWANRAGRRALA